MATAKEFQSTPSARRATHAVVRPCFLIAISIHALREEGDCISCVTPLRASNFNPRPPRGGRLVRSVLSLGRSLFQSTPSARRATRTAQRLLSGAVISIHALREEGDDLLTINFFQHFDFNPRPPRGGRPHQKTRSYAEFDFNPRPPRGGRPAGAVLPRAFQAISIHALREEGDPVLDVEIKKHRDFNPRPPRGGRLYNALRTNGGDQFQSTPSARRATLSGINSSKTRSISIHALREEGDLLLLLS